MSKTSLYKLFVWNPFLLKYIPFNGLHSYPSLIDRYPFYFAEDGSEVRVNIISIPFFNKHYSNPV